VGKWEWCKVVEHPRDLGKLNERKSLVKFNLEPCLCRLGGMVGKEGTKNELEKWETLIHMEKEII
jgi:hypothetical protein